MNVFNSVLSWLHSLKIPRSSKYVLNLFIKFILYWIFLILKWTYIFKNLFRGIRRISGVQPDASLTREELARTPANRVKVKYRGNNEQIQNK